MTALIAMACSATKRRDRPYLPAIDRYDGPMWKTLRSALEGISNRPEIWVLSARFGFIPASSEIPDYDCEMTESLAARIAVGPAYEGQIFAHHVESADKVLFAGGQLYRNTMHRAWDRNSKKTMYHKVTETVGGIGEQRAQLRAWINAL